MPIRNVNRTVGTMLSGDDRAALRPRRPARRHDPRRASRASAGQSFGAFLARGVTFELHRRHQRLLGKGLSGGRIVVLSVDPSSAAKPEENIIIGNTVLYGAIAGEAYFRGVAGERFCVRNSGATRGRRRHRRPRLRIHDRRHGRRARHAPAATSPPACSGGIAYVYDEDGTFAQRCNTVDGRRSSRCCRKPSRRAERSSSPRQGRLRHTGRADEALLRELIERHLRYTGSTRALAILDDWEPSRAKFVKVFPNEYQRALAELHAKRSSGRRRARQRVDSGTASDQKADAHDGQRSPAFMEFERARRRRTSRLHAARASTTASSCIALDDDDASKQGARCMDCGIPFCKSGCPVNNIIPDCNDLVYRQRLAARRSTCCTRPTTSPSSPAASARRRARRPAR